MTHTNTEALSERDGLIRAIFKAMHGYEAPVSIEPPFHARSPLGKAVSVADAINLSRRSASNTGGVEVKAYVADYLKSDGTTDYYVMIGADGREMSLHMHRIRGRAEYEAAEINHVISGSPKPEFEDFDVDGLPHPSSPVSAEVTK